MLLFKDITLPKTFPHLSRKAKLLRLVDNIFYNFKHGSLDHVKQSPKTIYSISYKLKLLFKQIEPCTV